MATRYEIRTFADAVRAVCETLKVQLSDTETVNRIKRNINTVYLNHVVPASDSWNWLNETVTVAVEPYFEGGTANVQQNVATVTLTQAPATSCVGKFFSVNGVGEIYRIAKHTAGSTSLTLEGPFNSPTNTAAKYKIWTDQAILPADCMKVKEVVSVGANQPLINVSLQQFRKHQISGGASIGSPSYYAEGPMKEPDPYLPISGLPAVVSRQSDGLTKTITFAADIEAYIARGDRIRVECPTQYQYDGDYIVSSAESTAITYTSRVALNEDSTADATITVQSVNTQNTSPAPTLLVYPSIQPRNQRINLVVDYQIYPAELISDNDEPRIPREHRAVLFYGAMWLSSDRETDVERADRYKVFMEQELQRMLGRSTATPKTPTMRVSPSYFKSKARSYGTSRYSRDISIEPFAGGAGGVGAPTATGTPNSVAVFDANGFLIGSSDVDLDLLEYLIGTQARGSVVLANNTTTTVDAFDPTQYKSADIQYVIQRGSSYRSGHFIITTDGSTTRYADYATTEIGDTGSTLLADLSGGQFRARVTLTDQGAGATIFYKVSLV